MHNLEQIYEQSSELVRPRGFSRSEAGVRYADYVNFVAAVCSAKGKVLDVGCGTGWSSTLLSEKGFITTGIDLNSQAFEPPTSETLQLLQGSATALPFADATFDVVATYQALEHISEPKQALTEMLRVLRPGGTLCIVGPNLLSIGNSVQAIAKYVWRNRPVRRIFLRDPQMARHPFGNTLPEAIITLPINLLRIVSKSLAAHATFTMRQPDLHPPFHADNDACYLCNPIDLCRWAREANCVVMQNGKLGRSKWTTLLAGGTWIALRKLS